MTRRTLNADGTLTLKSFSCFGETDVAKAFREEVAYIDAHNRKAQAEWSRLPLDEQERQTAEFEVQEKARREAAAQRFAKLETRSRAHPELEGELDMVSPIFI